VRSECACITDMAVVVVVTLHILLEAVVVTLHILLEAAAESAMDLH
jgi:hypothetical protein